MEQSSLLCQRTICQGKHSGISDGLCAAQLNASDESACLNGRLRLESRALAQIFIASTAELPGLLLAAMVMDLIGRKWCATIYNMLIWSWLAPHHVNV